MAETSSSSKFEQPMSIADAKKAFPGSVKELMPVYADIPDEFKRMGNVWADWQSQWFFKGLKEFPKPKPGIDLDKAKTHLATIQRSFEPKHEHKSAAVAYLASLWLEAPTV